VGLLPDHAIDLAQGHHLEKLGLVNRGLRTGNTYDKIGLAEPWRMGRIN
jgi:hypothetical protein